MTNKATKTAKTDTYNGSTMLRSVMQELFIDHIIAGLPQYEAYKKAGYKGKNEEIIRSNSTHLVTANHNVKARLAYKRAQLAKKADITAERVIAEMAKIGFSNIQDFTGRGNRIEDISTLSADQAAAIESIQTDIKGCKIKLHSKLGALNSLAEILKLKDVAGKTAVAVQIVNFADRSLEAETGVIAVIEGETGV